MSPAGGDPAIRTCFTTGGHVRTGLEDVVYFSAGEYAASSAQLVARAQSLCEAMGRPVAAPAQAREILGIGS